jgi:hypothetical protein
MNKKIVVDFSIGGVINSAKEWESKLNESDNWIDRSFEERLSAIEILRLQYLELFGLSTIPDYSFGGKRINND